MKYDFEGWATKNNLKCADGVVIRQDAFKVNNGKTVPLVWNHRHEAVTNILGHATLENRNEGVWAYCNLNDSPEGQAAKERIKHGDVTALSIWANNVCQDGSDIIHGVIREVSLVVAGANPGAFIESVISHGEPIGDSDDEGIFYTGEGIIISHADSEGIITNDSGKGDLNKENNEDKTVQQIIDTMTDEQKAAVGIIIEQVIQDAQQEGGNKENGTGEKKEEKEMKHNAFEGKSTTSGIISHSDMALILSDAKKCGSLKEAVNSHIENGVLSHSIDTTGMETAKGSQTYGFNDPSMLFPDYKSLSSQPERISRNMDWVNKLMNKIHHTPFSRIKSLYANITEDEARAKGYIKGKFKKEEVFTTLKRTTDPQTVYKKQKMDRDDIIDIIDFDVVAWIKSEMRLMLDEELARAMLIGDGRSSDSDDKIKEDHIRPIVTDRPLFNTIVKVTVPSNATDDIIAKETIKAIIRARKNYKGSGKPDLWTTEDVVTEMLLLEDSIGHTIYKTDAELATKLRVNEIIPVEPMEGYKVKITEGSTTKDYPLLGIVVNMADYNVGADKGGEVNMFDDFDIDYNQQKYLIETRISGALTKPFSALTIVLDKSATAVSANLVDDNG